MTWFSDARILALLAMLLPATQITCAHAGGPFITDDLSRSLGPNYRVLRGGSFALGGDLARGARRHGPHPGAPFRYRGFRLVMSQ